MKAMVYYDYGTPDVLKCEELEMPSPKESQVLLKVHAAAINPLDLGLMKGQPYFMRFLFGFPKPKVTRPGRDVAGEVQAVGPGVTRFKPGDEVFGVCTAGGWLNKCDGAFAEYACTLESGLAMKPDNMTFEQVAAAPIAALTALQGLRKGQIKSGQKVLINGAAGGVGTFAVQIAKTFGAEVTGVCSTRNVEMVHRIGADHVVDYTQIDFTKNPEKYDLIFDLVGNHSFVELRRVLVPKGIFVGAGVVGAPKTITGMLGGLVSTIVVSLFVSQKYATFVAKANSEDLNVIREMMASEKVMPVIDRAFDLSETAEAMRYQDLGHARGKIVITVPVDRQTSQSCGARK
jgi:NADPH:quinone reductase-like Zn-dependent oxidoreductase